MPKNEGKPCSTLFQPGSHEEQLYQNPKTRFRVSDPSLVSQLGTI